MMICKRLVQISLSTAVLIALAACSGGGGDEENIDEPDTAPNAVDTAAPTGYSVAFDTDVIDQDNETGVTFSVLGAEVGATFDYMITSGNASIADTGLVTETEFQIAGLDLSGFPDGLVLLELTLTDDAGNVGILATDSISRNTVSPGIVSLSGTVTFDFVPPFQAAIGPFGLDYDAIEQRPVRSATVQLLDESGEVIAATQTDQSGGYEFQVGTDRALQVRVIAETVATGPAVWDFSVTDNTNGDIVYALDGSLAQINNSDQTRDLNAGSGWTGSAYTEPRASAPFSILDTVLSAVETVVAVDPDVQMPPAELRWSINNTPVVGDADLGEIGSASYSPFFEGVPDSGNIFLLGDENVNTDEFDQHVIAHEWGHYFEDRLSRSDSIGGPHGPGDLLDLRLAFSEGWANAFSAIVLNDALVHDSMGIQQATGFFLNVESNFPTEVNGAVPLAPQPGWYNEFSVHSLVFDLYDAFGGEFPGDIDNVELGFGPIYETFTSEAFTEQSTFSSIFSFITQLAADQPAQADAISELISAQNINGTGFEGAGETNDGGAANALPIYQRATLNGGAVEVCTDNAFGNFIFGDAQIGEFNHLNNRAFVLVDLPADDFYNFFVTPSSGLADADPEIILMGPVGDEGAIIRFNGCGGFGPTGGTSESLTCSLPPSEYLIEVFDVANVDSFDDFDDGEDGDDTGGAVCFDVSVSN